MLRVHHDQMEWCPRMRRSHPGMRGKPRRHLDIDRITRGPLDFRDKTLGVGIHAFRPFRVSVFRDPARPITEPE